MQYKIEKIASTIFLSFLFTALIFFANVSAEKIELSFINDLIEKGDTAQGTIKIEVNESGKYFIDLYALGYESWITLTPSNTLYIEPNKPAYLNITFTAPRHAKAGSYAIYVYLKDSEGEIKAYDKRIVYVLESSDLKIESVKLKDPTLEKNEKLGIYLILRNYGKVDATGHRIKVTIPRLGIVQTYTLPIIKKESKDTYYIQINIGKVPAGTYEAIIDLYDNKERKVDTKKISFKVEPYSEIKEIIKEEFNFFRKSILLKIKNEGNDKGNYSYIIPTYLPFIYDINADETCKCNIEYTDKKYLITCVLLPDQTCNIKIIRNNWMEYLALISAILLIILIFWIYTTPHIKKYHYKKGHKYKVVIKVKNRHLKTPLREVVVKDKVNGLLKIIEESIIPKPSRIKKLKEYSLIEWHINELKPGEERIITYEVVPKIDVEGDIKMHEAELEGKVKNKRKKARAKSERK